MQLGFKPGPGTQNNSRRVDVALSKQFLNNKISVDGNFGVNNNQSTNTNGLIGDVNINYKLSDDGRYRLKGLTEPTTTHRLPLPAAYTRCGRVLPGKKQFETFNQLFKIYLDRFRKKETRRNSQINASGLFFQ